MVRVNAVKTVVLALGVVTVLQEFGFTVTGLLAGMGLAGMAVSIVAGVYLGAWVGIGKGARQHRSFIWWVTNRLLFLAAIGSIQGFAQYYLVDVVRVPKPATATTAVLAVALNLILPEEV